MSHRIGVAVFFLKLAGLDVGPQGIPTIVIALFFFGGLQLLFLGLIGEYIVAIFNQVRRRPIVVERERVNFLADEAKGGRQGSTAPVSSSQ